MEERKRLDFVRLDGYTNRGGTGKKEMRSYWRRGKAGERFRRMKRGVDVEGFVQQDPDGKLIMEQKH